METYNLKQMSLKQLKDFWRQKRDELLTIKKEIDRREGNEIPPASVDFESYITK